jgi:DNA-3-methyladenine glycosylase II
MHYKEHLSKDKKLKKLLEEQGPYELVRRDNLYFYLYCSIMSQQLSSKVAAVIRQRFLDLYDGQEPTPEQILATPLETLRFIGLSNAKTRYVHNVARFAAEQDLESDLLESMSNEDLIGHFTQIKGVGRWTSEMLLMFALRREDIFAVDDLGIQNAMKHLYRLDDSDRKQFREDLLRISQKWSPYRTYACMYLWGWKDSRPPVEKPKTAKPKGKKVEKRKVTTAKKTVKKRKPVKEVRKSKKKRK